MPVVGIELVIIYLLTLRNANSGREVIYVTAVVDSVMQVKFKHFETLGKFLAGYTHPSWYKWTLCHSGIGLRGIGTAARTTECISMHSRKRTRIGSRLSDCDFSKMAS